MRVLLAIGATSCIYAPLDLPQDVFGRPSGMSDATLLAAHTWIPFWFWGALWIGLSFVLLGLALWWVWREGDENQADNR